MIATNQLDVPGRHRLCDLGLRHLAGAQAQPRRSPPERADIDFHRINFQKEGCSQ